MTKDDKFSNEGGIMIGENRYTKDEVFKMSLLYLMILFIAFML